MIEPACFGSPAFVDLKTPVCAGCDSNHRCVEGALARLASFPDTDEVRAAYVRLHAAGEGRVGVSVSRRGVVRRTLTEGERGRLDQLSTRARGAAKRLAELGWFELAKRKLRIGLVPDAPNTRIVEALRALVVRPMERQELVAHFVATLGLSKPAAEVEVTNVVAVLRFGDLVQVVQGQLMVSQN